ncbi:MAG: GTPase ObgE [bacterium]
MKFIDEAVIYIKSGDGGRGRVSFFPKNGGPDGGEGGKGGSIIFKASSNKNTLIDFKFQTKYIAANGEPGGPNNRTGANSEDLVIAVPAGTIIKDRDTKKILADLDGTEKTAVILEGGKGGKGNLYFCTPSRQAPDYAQPGIKGSAKWVIIELKLLADVGIVGLPNAGKSTLISRVSAARPKIADYPFTTLVPNLGVVKYGDDDFVMADVPGLIEGAHQGTGLGIRFLKHIERTKVLVHMVDVSAAIDDPIMSIDVINNELAKFSDTMGKKPMLYVLNKIDSATSETLSSVEKYLKDAKLDFVPISAVTGEGIDILLKKVHSMLKGKLSPVT